LSSDAPLQARGKRRGGKEKGNNPHHGLQGKNDRKGAACLHFLYHFIQRAGKDQGKDIGTAICSSRSDEPGRGEGEGRGQKRYHSAFKQTSTAKEAEELLSLFRCIDDLARGREKKKKGKGDGKE